MEIGDFVAGVTAQLVPVLGNVLVQIAPTLVIMVCAGAALSLIQSLVDDREQQAREAADFDAWADEFDAEHGFVELGGDESDE